MNADAISALVVEVHTKLQLLSEQARLAESAVLTCQLRIEEAEAREVDLKQRIKDFEGGAREARTKFESELAELRRVHNQGVATFRDEEQRVHSSHRTRQQEMQQELDDAQAAHVHAMAQLTREREALVREVEELRSTRDAFRAAAAKV